MCFFLQDWNYKLQLKLSNVYIKNIPRTTRTVIYDENVTHVVLIHGAVEDCQFRKVYKAPFLIPVTCHQVRKHLFMSSSQYANVQQCMNIRKFSL
jgi:hypothetical protein